MRRDVTLETLVNGIDDVKVDEIVTPTDNGPLPAMKPVSTTIVVGKQIDELDAAGLFGATKITEDEFYQMYTVAGVLGVGGETKVVLAQAKSNGSFVAIRKKPLYDHDIESLAKDARALQNIDNPHVVKIYGFYHVTETQDRVEELYLVTEYKEQQKDNASKRYKKELSKKLLERVSENDIRKEQVPNLAQRIYREERFTVEQLRSLKEQLLLGLTAAHERGIIHRDTKPSNILLDDKGNASLIDFGVAKFQGDRTSTASKWNHMGSNYYMAPEQERMQKTTAETDYFGLGMTLIAAAIGSQPAAWIDVNIEVDTKLQIENIRTYFNQKAAYLPESFRKSVCAMIDVEPAKRREGLVEKVENARQSDLGLARGLKGVDGLSEVRIETASSKRETLSDVYNKLHGKDSTVLFTSLVGGIVGGTIGYYLAKHFGIEEPNHLGATIAGPAILGMVGAGMATVKGYFGKAIDSVKKRIEQYKMFDELKDLQTTYNVTNLPDNHIHKIQKYFRHENDAVRAKAFDVCRESVQESIKHKAIVTQMITDRIDQPSFYKGISYILECGTESEIVTLFDVLFAKVDNNVREQLYQRLPSMAAEHFPKNKTSGFDYLQFMNGGVWHLGKYSITKTKFKIHQKIEALAETNEGLEKKVETMDLSTVDGVERSIAAQTVKSMASDSNHQNYLSNIVDWNKKYFGKAIDYAKKIFKRDYLLADATAFLTGNVLGNIIGLEVRTNEESLFLPIVLGIVGGLASYRSKGLFRKAVDYLPWSKLKDEETFALQVLDSIVEGGLKKEDIVTIVGGYLSHNSEKVRMNAIEILSEHRTNNIEDYIGDTTPTKIVAERIIYKNIKQPSFRKAYEYLLKNGTTEQIQGTTDRLFIEAGNQKNQLRLYCTLRDSPAEMENNSEFNFFTTTIATQKKYLKIKSNPETYKKYPKLF